MTIKVLIVDDEPINVKLIEEILEYEDDFDYRSATNGLNALSLLNEYNPDIIILDIMMPGMSGYDVCKIIKSDKKQKFAKVIMVSGKAMIEERLEGYEAGADDYITKPFVDDELLAKLKVFSKLKKTEEIDELKTAILHLFSHETKTPLNGILNGSQLILDSPSASTKVKGLAQIIKMSGERIHNLVLKILLLSSLRNNKTLDKESQSITTYLQGVAEQTNDTTENSCEVVVSCPVDFTLDVDWKLFHEAFQAVVENGIKYSPPGEKLELSASLEETKVILKVIDQGVGIAPDIKEKIFDEFYSQNIEKHTGGTGLSLAIAKDIMNLHDGLLVVESKPDEGASFIFSLPLALAHKN
jgi:two-component system, sensor histidine kinase and response regulator